MSLATATEEKALTELADRVRKRGEWTRMLRTVARPIDDESAHLLRFLRLRDGNVLLAHDMLLANIAWREKLQLDRLADKSLAEVVGCDEPVMEHWLPSWHGGVDTHGRPVGWCKLGAFSVDAVLPHVPLERLRMFHLWERERMCRRLCEESTTRGATFGWFTLVIDMKGWHLGLMSRASLALAEELMNLDTELFAQRVGRVMVINAPYFFSALWACLTPFMSKETIAKVKVLSSQGAWLPELRKLCDDERIPREYGGSAASPMRDFAHAAPPPIAREASKSKTVPPPHAGVTPLTARCVCMSGMAA